jgi:hypothetical protein
MANDNEGGQTPWNHNPADLVLAAAAEIDAFGFIRDRALDDYRFCDHPQPAPALPGEEPGCDLSQPAKPEAQTIPDLSQHI